MAATALKVENLSKKFCRSLRRSLWYGMKDLACEVFLSSGQRDRLRQDEFWALKDISFEVARGETLGLVGHNGAGKSTLLKLINGLIRPDVGRVSTEGRVGALIELGTGFHPVLSGRENIYVNAAVLGLPRKEVERRLDEIIDFAEIGDFIDAPVQSYSSGMKVRLGFSIAAHLNPEILLIDEILSVGDSSFRQRCLDRLVDYKRGGGSVVFVSHNSTAVETICDRVVWLDHGLIRGVGAPSQILELYEAQAQENSRQSDLRLTRRDSSSPADPIEIISVGLYDSLGNARTDFEFGEPIEIRFHYVLHKEIQLPYFLISLQKGDRLSPHITVMNMMWDSIQLESIPRSGSVACIIDNPSFSPGTYRVHVGVQAKPSVALGDKWYVRPRERACFAIQPGALRELLPGAPSINLISHMPPVILEHSWQLNGDSLTSTAGLSTEGGTQSDAPQRSAVELIRD